MSNQFIAEIRLFAGNFAPQSWAFCDGSSQSIADNTALFSLIGTTYGGNGVTTFNLPDLRSRIPIHQGQLSGGGTYVLGQTGGTETVALTIAQTPAHTHNVIANATTANSSIPAGNYFAAQQELLEYSPAATANSTMKSTMVAPFTGSSLPHDNIMPYQVTNYIIALFGIYPSQN